MPAHIVRDTGITAAPVRIDAVLLSALVFLGVNIAWLLLFGAVPEHAAPAAKVTGAVRGPGPV